MSPYYYTDQLESPRLRTRWLTTADATAWSSFLADETILEFFPNPESLSAGERAQTWITKQIERYADKRFGLQALIDKQTNVFIGQCGLLVQEVDGQPEIEVGYHIFSQYRRKGYATEAAKLFFDFAIQHRQSDSLISIIKTSNVNSQKVADRNGLVRERQTVFNGSDVFIYRLDPDKIMD